MSPEKGIPDGHWQGTGSDRSDPAEGTGVVPITGPGAIWTPSHADRTFDALDPLGAFAGALDSFAGPGARPRVEPEPEAPVVLEPVWGYRGWRATQAIEPALTAASYRYEWKPGRNEAACENIYNNWLSGLLPVSPLYTNLFFELGASSCQSVPAVKHTCGFYARTDTDGVQGDIFGGVVGWGRLIKADNGWRSQYATIACLYSPPWEPSDRKALIAYLGEKYNVPLAQTPSEIQDKASAMADWMAGSDLKDGV